MKKIRTRQFRIVLCTVLILSAVFLGVFAMLGKKLVQTHFNGLLDAVFSVLFLAAGSFLVFCFFPYFRGDRRWYSIPALLTVVFLVGAAMLWQMPGTGVTL